MYYDLRTLKNGVRVVTVPMGERDSAGVAIWVRAGARFEPKKISGVSHYLEHMLFKGTAKRNTREIKEAIEGVGGLLNAFTGEESTCYFSKLLVEHVPTALEVLSDMVNHASLDKTEMDKERTVILEEIKMYRDLPAHHMHDLMGELLWPNQPLGRPIAGTDKTVSALSRAELAGYKKRFYHPKNILVSVSGPVDPEEIYERVEALFPQKSSGKAAKMAKAIVRQRKPQTLFVDKQTEQTHFVIGMHAISRFHPDRFKLGLLNIILGANMSSRLFEEVREKRGLAYEIKSGTSFLQDTGLLAISAGVEQKKASMAVRVILSQLAKMRKQKVKPGELRRAKDYFMSQLCMGLEDTLDHLLWAGERVLDAGELPDREGIREKVESVTERDIQEMARKLFVTRNLNLVLIGPISEKEQRKMKKEFEIHGA